MHGWYETEHWNSQWTWQDEHDSVISASLQMKLVKNFCIEDKCMEWRTKTWKYEVCDKVGNTEKSCRLYFRCYVIWFFHLAPLMTCMIF